MINVARQRYDKAVEVFKRTIRKSPESLANKYLLQLERKEFFKAETKTKDAPKI